MALEFRGWVPARVAEAGLQKSDVCPSRGMSLVLTKLYKSNHLVGVGLEPSAKSQTFVSFWRSYVTACWKVCFAVVVLEPQPQKCNAKLLLQT